MGDLDLMRGSASQQELWEALHVARTQALWGLETSRMFFLAGKRSHGDVEPDDGFLDEDVEARPPCITKLM